MDVFIQIVNGTKITGQFMVSSSEFSLQFLMTIFSVLSGFLFALISIWITERHKRKNAVSQSTQSILKEMEDHEIFIITDRKRPMLSLASDLRTRNEFFTFNGSVISTSALDSTIFSGTFREFPINDQQVISDYHNKIKLFNDLSGKLLEFITMGDMQSIHFKQSMLDYGEVIESKLDEIQNVLQSLRKLLQSKKSHGWTSKGYVN